MSPDRPQDRTLQLSQGLFGAPPGQDKAGTAERREHADKPNDAEVRPD